MPVTLLPSKMEFLGSIPVAVERKVGLGDIFLTGAFALSFVLKEKGGHKFF